MVGLATHSRLIIVCSAMPITVRLNKFSEMPYLNAIAVLSSEDSYNTILGIIGF